MKAWLIKLVALLCCLIPVSVSAQTFSIMTEEYPPFNYTEEGKLTGLLLSSVRYNTPAVIVRS